MTSQEAFDGLAGQQEATLIDVRTQAEWSFVGVPDLRPLGKEPILAEWQSFPSTGPNPAFAESVSDVLVKKDLTGTRQSISCAAPEHGAKQLRSP